MNASTVKTTTPEDFVILTKYVNQNQQVVDGNFPIYISTASECCLDSNKNQEITPIVIPVQ